MLAWVHTSRHYGHNVPFLYCVLFNISRFKVIKSSTELSEYLKLEFLRILGESHAITGAEGVNTITQLAGMLARLCMLAKLDPNAQQKT